MKVITITYILKQKNSNLYKIGKTINLDKRLSQYNTHNPNYFLVGTINKDIELELHNYFNPKRVSNEWFDLTREDINYLYSIEGFEINNYITINLMFLYKIKHLKYLPSFQLLTYLLYINCYYINKKFNIDDIFLNNYNNSNFTKNTMSRPTLYKCVKELKDNHIIIKIKKGLYKFNENLLNNN